MTKTEQDLRAIHTRACTAVALADWALTPADDAFWPLYLQSVLALAGVASDLPKRAVQFRVDVGADDLRALSSTLFNLSNQIAAEGLSSHSVSGGYDSGYEHWMTVSDRPTHAEYAAQLDVWLEARKARANAKPQMVMTTSDANFLKPELGNRRWYVVGGSSKAHEEPTQYTPCHQHVGAAAQDVLSERQRQMSVEGWTSEHDDEHGPGALALAAAAYALDAGEALDSFAPANEQRAEPLFWPFSSDWWKPVNPRRSLVKAAALIIAEIERIDRDPGDESGNHHTRGGDHA
jgi:hypothetical protein